MLNAFENCCVNFGVQYSQSLYLTNSLKKYIYIYIFFFFFFLLSYINYNAGQPTARSRLLANQLDKAARLSRANKRGALLVYEVHSSKVEEYYFKCKY